MGRSTWIRPIAIMIVHLFGHLLLPSLLFQVLLYMALEVI